MKKLIDQRRINNIQEMEEKISSNKRSPYNDQQQTPTNK